ncbi:MAG: DASS family sodium-coupled anion symporter [Rhodopirellula sp.]|nr:DASS family sodium-coupled anion symporter [Rhodopirellula sp.]
MDCKPPPAYPGKIALIWAGRIGAPALAVLMYYLTQWAGELPEPGRRVAAVGAMIGVLWVTEALPLPITSLIPLILFPLAGVLTFDEAARPYANPYIFLFMGGFMIAQAIERWNLHRRIALLTVLAVGTRPRHLVGGFMIATAMLSMWISNTATAMMMLPIGLSVASLLADRLNGEEPTAPRRPGRQNTESDDFTVAVLLGIAYAASIGGIGTLVGTPPNTFLAGFLATKGISISFGRWMLFAVPLSMALLATAWLMLVFVFHPLRMSAIPGGRQLIRTELRNLGKVSRGEWTVLGVFVVTALAWIFREPIGRWDWLVARLPIIERVNDPMIALGGALLLFIVPVDLRRGVFALDWETAVKLPWGVLLLFGGGLSLAAAAVDAGFNDWVGQQVAGLHGLPAVVLVLVVCLVVVFLTEIASNTAVATAFLPIVFGAAQGMKIDPLLLAVPTALAASCAFMLPAATAPNAIIFSSGRVTIWSMARAGFWLNLAVVALLPGFVFGFAAWALGFK